MKLRDLMEKYPQLIFDNNGYEKLSPEIVLTNKSAIKEIEVILKKYVKGFVSFQNFKPRKDGSIAVRYQVLYDDEGTFTGVAYTDLSVFEEMGA